MNPDSFLGLGFTMVMVNNILLCMYMYVLLKGPSPLSLYKLLPSLTGNISVATVHVRLPIPTLNAAVNSICRRKGVFDSSSDCYALILLYTKI